MKTVKRILSILLSLALGLAFALPAGAAEPVKGGPFAPIITKEPAVTNEPSLSILRMFRVGDTIILETEADLPEGADGELSYAWYDYAYPDFVRGEPLATGQRVELVLTNDMVDTLGSGISFCYLRLVVSNTYVDENSEGQIACETRDIYIEAFPQIPWWGWIIAIPLLPAMLTFGLGGGAFAFLLLPVMAFEWIRNLFR